MKTKIKIIFFSVLLFWLCSNSYAETKEIVYTDHEWVVTIKCSEYPGYSDLKLTVNGVSETIPCDKTPPKWTVSYNPSTWTNKDVIVTVKCSDDISWCEKNEYTKKVTKNEIWYIKIKDKAWNTTSIYYYAKIDKSSPNVSFSCDNNSYNVDWEVKCKITWNNSNIWAPETLMFNWKTKWGILPIFNDYKYTSNSLSCIEKKKVKIKIFWRTISSYTKCIEYERPQQIYSFTNNWTYNITWKVLDNAGNTSKIITKLFKIDTSKPSINTKEDFRKWYNYDWLKDLKFQIKDQTSSTDSNEESGLEKVIVTLNWKDIQVNWFKKTTWTTSINITIKKADILKLIKEWWKNKLVIKAVDKVWHSVSITKYIKYDNSKPKLDVSNKDYSWKNENVKIKLNSIDQIWLSWLVYSKYIWDNKDNCSSKWNNFQNWEEIILSDEWKHNLYICNKDNAWNINIKKFWEYKLDKTKSKLDINNKDYSWKNKDIKIKLNTSDSVSWLSYSKYIWDNVNTCVTNWTNYTDWQEIVLSTEWEHILYLCNKDNAWNFNVINYGTYKLDKSIPTIKLIHFVDKKLAWNDNFNIQFKLYDNLGNNFIFNRNYNKYNINYKYDIIADTKSVNNINWTVNSNILINNKYSLTDASEKWEKFKIIFNFEDKAGNTGSLEKEFFIYPNIIDEWKSSFSIDWGTKYANMNDKYTVNLFLKDEFWNNIYNKNISNIQQDNFIKTKDNSDALIEEWYNKKSDENWKLDFTIKSLCPWVFSPNFYIKFKKWWDNNEQNLSEKIINLSQTGNKEFLKPFIWKLEVDSSEWTDWKPKITGHTQRYILTLENKTNLNVDWTVNISSSNIINKIDWHYWDNFSVTDNKFASNSDLILWFNAEIKADSNYLKSPIIWTKDLKIEYTLWWKLVEYILSNSTSVWEAWSVTEEATELWELTGIEPEETTLGLKVVWTLEWDWKSDEVWQVSNFSDLSKWNIRAKIRRNAYKLIKNRKNNTVVNWVKYVEWDVELIWEQSYETLIVKDWNVLIKWDLNTNWKKFWIIVLKDNYRVQDWLNQKWNIFVKDNVSYINAILYADGWLFSTWTDLSNQLVIKWSLFTRNTIWWGVWDCTLPWWKADSSCILAKKYDLNYIRTWNNNLVSSYHNWNEDNFVIIHNPSIQTNPPKGFSE